MCIRHAVAHCARGFCSVKSAVWSSAGANGGVDSRGGLHNMFWTFFGAFVYQLGHGPLKAERRVRFPYALPIFRRAAVAVSHRRASPIGVTGAGACRRWSAPEADMRPFQFIFNPTSAAELARMPKELQLHILGEFRGLPQEVMSTELERYGKLERNGKTLHRFRIGDYRIYFERHELGLVVHRILSKNSLKDFLFRSNLPVGEDEALQENPKFWELIESARTSSTAAKE